MDLPVNTPAQTRSTLRLLRKSKKMTQAELGEKLGINQKRVARIEAFPDRTNFDQIARMVLALGGDIVVRIPDEGKKISPSSAKKRSTSTW